MPVLDSPPTGATENAQPGTLLQIDSGAFAAHFNRTPFTIGHCLGDHPLFTLARLIALSRSLTAEQVEYNAGQVPIGMASEQTPRNGLSVEETIRRIEECSSWMALRNVESDPEYQKLLLALLEEVRPHADKLDPGMIQPEGYIFISSPLSVTPYHTDPEHNFLLQVRGRKTVHLFPALDRGVLSEEQLETFYTTGRGSLEYKEAYEAKGGAYELGPDQGLYFPVTAPHWVKNGPEVSISFSITWRTLALERRGILYRVNAMLRRRGLRPVPPGRSGLRDFVKYQGYRVCRRLGRLVFRSKQ